MAKGKLRRFAKGIGTFIAGITLTGFALGCGDSPLGPERGSRLYTLEQGKPVAVGLEGIGNYLFTLKRAYPSGQGRTLADIEVQAIKRTKTISFDPFYEYREGLEGLKGEVSHLVLFNGDFLDRSYPYLSGVASTPTADFVIEEVKGAKTPSLEDDIVGARLEVNKYLR